MAAEAFVPARHDRVTFRVCSSVAEFRKAAATHRAGQPIPLLDGHAVRRDLGTLGSQAPLVPLPDPHAHPVGVVLGDEDDDPDGDFTLIGRLLAATTGRPLREVDPCDLPAVADGTLTVVCAPERLDPLVLSGAGARIGFFTARTAAAACALLVRTLVDDRPAGTLVFDPTDAYLETPTRLLGPAVGFLPLVVLNGERTRLTAAGRSHGRECMMGIGEESLCARRDQGEERPSASGAGRYAAACQHSQECVKRDLDPRTALTQPRAHDLNAAAVLLDSCRSVAINGMFSADVSLALATLDSRAVVVAGCPVARQGPAYTPALFTAMVTAGLTAAEVVHTLNESAGNEAYGDLVLLGDAARRWPGDSHVLHRELIEPAAELAVDGASVLRLRTDPVVVSMSAELAGTGAATGLLTICHAPGDWLVVHQDGIRFAGTVRVRTSTVPIHDHLRDLILPTLDNLAAWPDHGLPIPTARLRELSAEAAALASTVRPATTAALTTLVDRYEKLVESVLALQGELVEDWLDRIERGVDRYTDDWPQPVVFGERTPMDCPSCTTPCERIAAVAGLRTRTPLEIVLCPHCGEVAAGAADTGCVVGLSIPDRAVCGQSYLAELSVAGPAEPALVSVGLAVSHQALAENRIRFRDDRLIETKGELRWSVHGRVGRRASVDSHTLRHVAVINGRPVRVERTMWVRPGRRG
jgi:hypothetical protein